MRQEGFIFLSLFFFRALRFKGIQKKEKKESSYLLAGELLEIVD